MNPILIKHIQRVVLWLWLCYYAVKITTIGSPMAGHLCDTNIVALLDKEW